jgi:hypothetical protein
MSFLNGFKKDMKTNYSLILGLKHISCNMDSNSMPNNRQDSVCRSEIEAIGGIPPAFKKELDGSIEVSLRTTSTKKFRKRQYPNML